MKRRAQELAAAAIAHDEVKEERRQRCETDDADDEQQTCHQRNHSSQPRAAHCEPDWYRQHDGQRNEHPWFADCTRALRRVERPAGNRQQEEPHDGGWRHRRQQQWADDGEPARGKERDAQGFERHARLARAERVARVAAKRGEACRRWDHQKKRDDWSDLFDRQREALEAVARARALERVQQHPPPHPGECPQGPQHD